MLIVMAGCSTHPKGGAQPVMAPAGAGDTVTVRLSDFAYDPDHLRLRTGVPVRLHLANEGSGEHDFHAPAFFAASSFQPGFSAPHDGDVEVPANQSVDIGLIPGTPGTYPVDCTHFLHTLFGMEGTVEVVP
jgi:plastocyanin